jgi:nucleotide-binding universal stress UspA family protein
MSVTPQGRIGMLRVVATLDGSDFSREILPVLSNVLRELPAEVTLLTVIQEPRLSVRTHEADARPSAGALDAPGVSPAALIPPTEPALNETLDRAVDRVTAEAWDMLEHVAEPLRQQGMQVNSHVLVDDHPAQAIISYARDQEANMIAMASHGRGAVGRLVQGSVAAEVLRSGVAPVLLVRPQSLERRS